MADQLWNKNRMKKHSSANHERKIKPFDQQMQRGRYKSQ